MELPLYSINNLKTMEVVEINSGYKLGYIKDLKIDCDNYKIISIIVPMNKGSWLSKNNQIEIPWQKVKKVGVDVILIDDEKIEPDKM